MTQQGLAQVLTLELAKPLCQFSSLSSSGAWSQSLALAPPRTGKVVRDLEASF